jgi:hypothetical protein
MQPDPTNMKSTLALEGKKYMISFLRNSSMKKWATV